MDFNLSATQRTWQSNAQQFAREMPGSNDATAVVPRAARAGLIDRQIDLLSAALAIEAVAWESAVSAVTLAMHTSVVCGLDDESLTSGEMVGAIALSSEDVPASSDGVLSGRASWVAPLSKKALAIVGVKGADGLEAVAVALDRPGVAMEPIASAGLRGLVCGHLRFDRAAFAAAGPTTPFMARVRVLLAAAGIGMGQRALHESLKVARGHTGRGAGGEQTVQGLLADAATDLDAARMLMWRAASSRDLSLSDASMAKLASTEATQRAVARATQVVGVESFRSGHILEQLAQDVRALELFAGRTEALREAVAADILPHA
ncbi:MAG TPA: acyl-CoA dehydrogenase family protein [Vicinamibacterales bacterium]